MVVVTECRLTDLPIAFSLSVGLLDQYLKVLETSYSKEISITYYLHFVSTRKMSWFDPFSCRSVSLFALNFGYLSESPMIYKPTGCS